MSGVTESLLAMLLPIDGNSGDPTFHDIIDNSVILGEHEITSGYDDKYKIKIGIWTQSGQYGRFTVSDEGELCYVHVTNGSGYVSGSNQNWTFPSYIDALNVIPVCIICKNNTPIYANTVTEHTSERISFDPDYNIYTISSMTRNVFYPRKGNYTISGISGNAVVGTAVTSTNDPYQITVSGSAVITYTYDNYSVHDTGQGLPTLEVSSTTSSSKTFDLSQTTFRPMPMVNIQSFFTDLSQDELLNEFYGVAQAMNYENGKATVPWIILPEPV